MQGRLKSITLKTSQEAWQLDLDERPAPAAPSVHGQPQAPIRVPITTSHITSHPPSRSAPAQRNQKRAASASEPAPENDDDDDFMPPTKQHSGARASSSTAGSNLRNILGESAMSKLPFVRCVPSLFNKFTDNLNMPQRTIISKHGFGCLLQFFAEELQCSDLLVCLMDKLNPDSMILEVGNEGGLEITELCVKNVFELPHGDMDPPSSTEEENARALAEFRKSVHVERNKEVKCNYLLSLLKKLNIENALAVRIFFIVAFNKLLFPALDHSIRGRDAFLTKDLSQFHNINWCKAVVQELRHAAIMWRSEKKKSIPGCGIFLIIFYLDNLDSPSSINHLATPWAKYFHKDVIEKLLHEDRRIDRTSNVTYGNLQLKNKGQTCYKYTEPARNGASAVPEPSFSPMFPGAEEIGILLSRISSSSSRNKAVDGLKQFDLKASQAINAIQSGSHMLVDAHKEFVHSIRNVIVTETADERRTCHDSADKRPAENQSRSNDHFSFFQCGPSCSVPHHQTPPSEFIGPRDVPIADQSNEIPVQDVYSDVLMPSIDHTIPNVGAQGCSDPTTPMHINNLHDIQESRGAVESHSESNHEQYVHTLDEVECASTIISRSGTSNDGNMTESAILPETPEDLGINNRARPRIDRLVNVPSRYRSPFRCITPRPGFDMAKAHAVRRKICTELKERRQFIFFGSNNARCKEVAEYFADGGRLYKSFMNYYVDCIRAEEEFYRPNCVGSRVFLSGSLGEMLNHDEERQQADHPDLAAFIKLRADIGDLDVFKVKLFLVPIPHNNHYTVYCLNMVDFRIDILDSSNEDHVGYHKVVGDRVVSRLNQLFQDLTDDVFKDFSNWKRPVTRVMRETDPNDSPFISMKVMKIWDGNKLHSKEQQVNMSDLRSERLYYMLYNTVNGAKKLPYGLEEYRPRDLRL